MFPLLINVHSALSTQCFGGSARTYNRYLISCLTCPEAITKVMEGNFSLLIVYLPECSRLGEEGIPTSKVKITRFIESQNSDSTRIY